MTAGELFNQGRLTDALAASVEGVKAAPSDPAPRYLLAELLCYAGEYERADTHLDVIQTQKPEIALTISLFRQLIRADQARQQFYSHGRVPEMLFVPDDAMQARMRATIATRENRLDEATALLQQVESLRPEVKGQVDGVDFDDMRDLDDGTSGVFEMLTPTGKFYLVPAEKVESIEFRKPEGVRDLLYRAAAVSVREGPEGEVFIPCLYPGSLKSADDAIRLGRATDWVGAEGHAIRGLGQRMFIFDGKDKAISSISRIAITAS